LLSLGFFFHKHKLKLCSDTSRHKHRCKGNGETFMILEKNFENLVFEKMLNLIEVLPSRSLNFQTTKEKKKKETEKVLPNYLEMIVVRENFSHEVSNGWYD